MLQNKIQASMPQEKLIDLFTYKITSNQPIDKIPERISDACEKHKFSLLQTYVYHEILESKGFPIKRKVFVYEICQAKTASAMLKVFPHFSIFMPCKLAVYEDNGKTIISTMNMEIMLNAIGSNQELYKEATTLFNTLKSVMDSLSD